MISPVLNVLPCGVGDGEGGDDRVTLNLRHERLQMRQLESRHKKDLSTKTLEGQQITFATSLVNIKIFKTLINKRIS